MPDGDIPAAKKAMTISHHDLSDGAAVITLSGRVTLGTTSEQIVIVTEELLREGKRTIIFDLAGVTGIDSTGIGRFISSYNKILAVRGEMRMAGAAGHLLDVFHISQLDRVFPFYATLPEAAAA
jgi:anti-sigma B factor antagonist